MSLSGIIVLYWKDGMLFIVEPDAKNLLKIIVSLSLQTLQHFVALFSLHLKKSICINDPDLKWSVQLIE